jgi:hypothetical protein
MAGVRLINLASDRVAVMFSGEDYVMKKLFAIFATSLTFVVWRARIIGLIVLLSAGFQLLQARHAQARTVDFESTVSGTTTSALLAFDKSEGTAGQFLGSGVMQPGGRITDQGVSQITPDGNSCTLPGGVPNAGTEFKLVGDAAVFRFDPSGDLLYTQATSETQCADLSSGTPPFPVVGSGSGVFIGGTGKYAGATGSFTVSFTATVLVLPGGVTGTGPGFGSFAAAQVSFTGTLTTP